MGREYELRKERIAVRELQDHVMGQTKEARNSHRKPRTGEYPTLPQLLASIPNKYDLPGQVSLAAERREYRESDVEPGKHLRYFALRSEDGMEKLFAAARRMAREDDESGGEPSGSLSLPQLRILEIGLMGNPPESLPYSSEFWKNQPFSPSGKGYGSFDDEERLSDRLRLYNKIPHIK